MNKYIDYFKESFNLEFIINDENSKIIHKESTTTLAEKESNRVIFYLKRFNENNFINRYTSLKKISIPYNFDYEKILIKNYKITYFSIISGLLNLNENEIEEIKIVNYKNKLAIINKTIEIGTDKFEELIGVSKEIYNKGNSSKSSMVNYLINLNIINFKGKPKRTTTYYNSDDFDFQINKLNLNNKSSKKDFEKYLSKKDIQSLQKLTDKLIKLEVFEPEFIKGLDAYFIKQKLQEIISLGREILSLKSEDISTEKAKEIAKKIKDGGNIRQLESFWQLYFEKYLLHLIFSYRELFPKFQFKIDAERKYPDFFRN